MQLSLLNIYLNVICSIKCQKSVKNAITIVKNPMWYHVGFFTGTEDIQFIVL